MEILKRREAEALGLDRYFTGKPCVNGNISVRSTSGCKCLCKECRDSRSGKAKIIASRDPEKTKAKKREWYYRQKELYESGEKEKPIYDKEKSARYYAENKKRHNAWMADWYSKNKGMVNDRRKHRYRADPVYRCQHMLRSIASRVIADAKIGKPGKTFHVLGYSPEDFKRHIERQFLSGMSWDNHGEWHVDHIVSVSEMILSGITDPAKINALSNLRPLWAKDNLSKSNKQTSLL